MTGVLLKMGAETWPHSHSKLCTLILEALAAVNKRQWSTGEQAGSSQLATTAGDVSAVPVNVLQCCDACMGLVLNGGSWRNMMILK